MPNEIRNLNNKLICTLSEDSKTAIIRKGNCETVITANPDGTLNIKQAYLNLVA